MGSPAVKVGERSIPDASYDFQQEEIVPEMQISLPWERGRERERGSYNHDGKILWEAAFHWRTSGKNALQQVCVEGATE